MQPKDYFNKPIIGRLRTRKIDKLQFDGIPASIDQEVDYDIIDVVLQGVHKFYVVNQWEDEKEKAVLAIHNNFVKETTLDEQERNKLHEQGFRSLRGKSELEEPVLSKPSGFEDRTDKKRLE